MLTVPEPRDRTDTSNIGVHLIDLDIYDGRVP